MARGPLVTIGMPVRNGGGVIAQALDSILAQTAGAFELIIADNASSDDTEEICRMYAERDARVRYVRHDRNIGAAGNFNFVFHQGRGRYFKWAAHDDVIAPTYLQRCLERFEQGPRSLVLCYPQRQLITPDGWSIASGVKGGGGGSSNGNGEARANGNGHHGRNGWPPQPPALGPSFAELLRRPADEFPMYVFGLVRRAALRRTRLLRPFPSADLVLVTELRLLGPFGAIPEPLFFQRRHPPDETWRARKSKRGEAQWYDPRASDGNGRALSTWRLFTEHLRGIADGPVHPMTKVQAYLAMSAYFPARIRRRIRRGSFVRRLKEEIKGDGDAKLY